MQNLDEFIKNSKNRLQAILDQLGWQNIDIKESNSSPIQAEALQNEDEEPPFPDGCPNRNSVVLDEEEFRKLLSNNTAQLPKKFSDLQILKREEKLLLYEHTRSHMKDKAPLLDEKDDLVSLADIVAIKKQERKNRRRHRVSKPTYNEELRNLVELQMQALEQKFKDINANAKNDTVRKDKKEKQTRQELEKHERKYSRRSHHEERSKNSNHKHRNELSDRINTDDKQRKNHKEHRSSKKYHRSRSKERLDTYKRKHKKRSRSRSHSHHRKKSKKHKSNKHHSQRKSRSRSRSRRR